MSHFVHQVSTSFWVAAVIVSLFGGSVVARAANPSLDWMAGHWCIEQNGNTTEELWLPPVGGVLVGLGRTRTNERTTGYEYLRIVDVDGVQSFIAQPGGRLPTAFKRTAGGEQWVRFENPDHDFPQSIEYRREGSALHAEVAGPGDNGEESVISYDYSPCGTWVGT